jgi:hypothetical protein
LRLAIFLETHFQLTFKKNVALNKINIALGLPLPKR